MDQEREDYAELDLPPPWPRRFRTVLYLSLTFFLILIGACTWFWFAVLIPAQSC